MQSGNIQIRVSDMIFVLKKRWKMVLSLTAVGLVFGLLLLVMTYVQNSTQSYTASGSFAISTQNTSGVYINGSQVSNNNDFHLAEDMSDAVLYVIRSNHVLNTVIAQENLLGVTPDDLRAKLSLTQYQATQIIEMRFTWSTADGASSIWQAIVSAASETLPSTLQVGQLAVINQPEVVQVGTSSASKLLPLILALLGFGCGIGFAVIELLIRPTLNNARDAETMFGLETIGIIPRDDAYFRQHQGALLTQDENERSEILQNYSAAAYILRNRLGTKEQHHCFYITSAVAGEGKSTVAANLAIQLSDMEHKTLLIDFDIRNPSIGTLFMDKVDYAHSLNALYRGEATEEDAIMPLTGYLDLLPAVLEHNAMSMDGTITELIQRLREKYEYIILDSAPVGEASETLSLNRVANTVLFVIEYDSTPLPVIQSALEKLDKSGIRVLGCVVNAVGDGRQKTGRTDNHAASYNEAPIWSSLKEPRPKKKRSPAAGTKPTAGEENAAAPEQKKNAGTEIQPGVQSAPPARRRNVMSELMAEETPENETARSTQSIMDELMRMSDDKRDKE